MNDLLPALRARVDEIIAPHREMYGPEAPVVKMALLVLAEAEAIAQKISQEKVTTTQAVELTGWDRETLSKYARARLRDNKLPTAWSGLEVERAADGGYVFMLGTIPENPRRQAA